MRNQQQKHNKFRDWSSYSRRLSEMQYVESKRDCVREGRNFSLKSYPFLKQVLFESWDVNVIGTCIVVQRRGIGTPLRRLMLVH